MNASPALHRDRSRGFTLVEMLLALTLMSMLLALTYGGMLAATVFGVFMIPLLYVVVQTVAEKLGRTKSAPSAQPTTAPPGEPAA